MNQQVPENINMMLTEAKKQAEKRHAKRIANRKSACTSRARKKALVKEMTELNARLRRQALILALLPDLVIVIDCDGRITFCSAQAERILKHSSDDLVGAMLTDILIPASREKLAGLMQQLTAGEVRPPARPVADNNGDEESGLDTTNHEQPLEILEDPTEKRKGDEAAAGSAKKSSSSAFGDLSAGGVVVSDPSFPLSVVKVDPTADAAPTSDVNENSDTSAGCKGNDKQPSSLTNSSSDDGNTLSNGGPTNNKKAARLSKKALPSSDISNTSSASANKPVMLNANANLERNVRWYNEKMGTDRASKLRSGYKDDVTGAAVTANNATARLSSLQHRPESSAASSGEDDSGYRESNDSREETSSSEEDSSDNNGAYTWVVRNIQQCIFSVFPLLTSFVAIA
jgi:PAS domain S-box-containing protein